MTAKITKAMEIIKTYCAHAKYGIFDTQNLVDGETVTVYADAATGLIIDICYLYGYFEVFGLSDEEFTTLKNYYKSLVEK